MFREKLHPHPNLTAKPLPLHSNHLEQIGYAPGDQLLDEEARHDRLARARVIGEQEAQRLTRQHGLIDRGDLVRQRFDQ
jgi:hypothetical protein